MLHQILVCRHKTALKCCPVALLSEFDLNKGHHALWWAKKKFKVNIKYRSCNLVSWSPLKQKKKILIFYKRWLSCFSPLLFWLHDRINSSQINSSHPPNITVIQYEIEHHIPKWRVLVSEPPIRVTTCNWDQSNFFSQWQILLQVIFLPPIIILFTKRVWKEMNFRKCYFTLIIRFIDCIYLFLYVIYLFIFDHFLSLHHARSGSHVS